MGARQRARGGSRTGTVLALIGALGILTFTFVAGLWTGRHWPLLTGAGASASRSPAPESDGLRRAAGPPPALTFYRELAAPVTALAPAGPPRPARPPDRGEPPSPRAEVSAPPEPPAAAARPAVEAAPASRVELPARGGERAAERDPAGADRATRYAVQVGAYRARSAAEALRASLSAAGLQARIVEADASAGARYRVRIGPYATRDAAAAVASRLASERAMQAFVTTR